MVQELQHERIEKDRHVVWLTWATLTLNICLSGCDVKPDSPQPSPNPQLTPVIDYLDVSHPITYEYIPVRVRGQFTRVSEVVAKRAVTIYPNTDARAALDVILAEPLFERPVGVPESSKYEWWHHTQIPRLSSGTSLLRQDVKGVKTEIVVAGTFLIVLVNEKEVARGFTQGCLGAALPLLRPQDLAATDPE